MFMSLKNQLEVARAMNRKGLGSAAGLVIGAMVTVIVVVQVALPVIQNAVDNTSATGTARTILNILPTLVALVGLIVLANLIT